MKYIKLFEDFISYTEIVKVCDKYLIDNYTINDDGSIDVDGDVNIGRYLLSEFPLEFRNVTGNFYCGGNSLTTLKGGPIRVGGYFDCTNNNLTSLEYTPSKVGGYFDCSGNAIQSLEDGPISVGGFYDCSHNNLTSLVGAPSSIKGHFTCSSNNLTSLKGAPKEVLEEFYCRENNLYSFEYLPDFSGSLKFPDNLNYIFSLFDDNKELIDAFNDYNIIKEPKISDEKPRLKVSNLNKFLTDNGFEEVEDTSKLEKYYDLK